MNHPGERDIHCPDERAIHFRGNIKPHRRLANNPECVNRLDRGHARRLIDSTSPEINIKPLSPNQFCVGNFPGGIRRHTHYRFIHTQ